MILFTGGGGAWSGGCLVWGGAWSRGDAWLGGPGGDLPKKATAAGGMHPTGMHSCLSTYLGLDFLTLY